VAAATLDAEGMARYRGHRISTFAFTWSAYALYYVGRNNLSVSKSSLIEAGGLTTAQLGDIDTAYLTAYAIGQFVSGTIGDRIPAKWLVGAGLIGVALTNAMFGAGSGFTVFLLAWTLNGFAQSTGWPGCTKAFSEWFAQRERGTVMGLWCTCYQVGAAVATFLGTWLLTTWGWRSAFFGPAIGLAGFAVLLLAGQRRAPADEGLPSAETYYATLKGERAAGDALPPATDAPAGSAWADVIEVLKSRPLWTLGTTYVVIKFTRYSFLFWLPLYMREALGYSEGEAGYTSVTFGIAGTLGAMFAGVASDRLFRARRAPIVVIMMALLAVATWAYADLSTLGRTANIIGIALVGFLLYGPDSVTSGVAAVDFGNERAASLAAGFVNGLGSIGGALSGVVIGRVSTAYGWEAVFSLFAPMCACAALLMTTLWNARGETS
jgi:sugar phosphate permease